MKWLMCISLTIASSLTGTYALAQQASGPRFLVKATHESIAGSLIRITVLDRKTGTDVDLIVNPETDLIQNEQGQLAVSPESEVTYYNI
jgi:hypothetical protein